MGVLRNTCEQITDGQQRIRAWCVAVHGGAQSEPFIANAEELTRPSITWAEMWDTCHVNTCAAAGESFSSGRETFDAETDEATEATLRRRAVRGTYSRRNQCRKRRKRR